MELITDISEIRQITAEIKRCKGNFMHNLFVNDKLLQDFIRRWELYCIRSEQSGVLLRKRRAGYQLYLITANEADLNELLRQVKKETAGHRLIADVPGRNVRLENFLADNEFRFYFVFQRMSRFNEAGGDFVIPEEYFARQDELPQIYDLLNGFDDSSAQLPDSQELLQLINNRKVIVSRTEAGAVASVIVFETKGMFIHWMFWVTDQKQRSSLHGMRLYMVFNKYMQNFKRQVLFLPKGNPVIKIHLNAGFTLDGFEDAVYVWEREAVE